MIACGQGAAQMNIGKSDIDGFVLPFSDHSDNLNYVAEVLRVYDNSIGTNLRILNLFILAEAVPGYSGCLYEHLL